MDIQVTGFTEPKSWYRERVGSVFKVLEESKDIDGNKVYIVAKSHIIVSYVDARDCIVLDDKVNK
jgi:hypothetical protein